MKKILIVIALVLAATILTACGKKEETKKSLIIGSWKHTSGYVYTFNEDMTGSYSYGDSKMEFTYEDDGKKVTILYTGNTAASSYKYKVEGKKLTIKDSFDNDVIYIKQ